jgi:hypothetical protein
VRAQPPAPNGRPVLDHQNSPSPGVPAIYWKTPQNSICSEIRKANVAKPTA